MKIISYKAKQDSIVIAPFGDLQYGNEACSLKSAKKYLEFAKEVSKRFRCELKFLGTGDYIDLMSPSNRERYKASGIYASSRRLIEGRATMPLMRELRDFLKPYMGAVKGESRTIALCQGHHYMLLENGGAKSSDGSRHFHTDTWLGAELGMQPDNFVEAAAIVKIEFPNGRVYRIHITHGQGNSSATGTYGLNKLSRQSNSWEAIDCFVMGHTHRAGVSDIVQLRERDGDLVSRQSPLLTSGAFMKSYLTDQINYPEAQQLGGVALGGIVLYLRAEDVMLQAPIALF